MTLKSILVVMLLLSLSACSQAAATAEVQPTKSQVERLATATADQVGERYVVEEGSFSLSLPEGWQVVGPIEATAGETAFTLYRLGLDPAASGGPGTSSIIIADRDALTVEEFVQAQCSTCPAAPLEDIQLGDVSARQTVIGGGSVPIKVTWTFFEHNGKLIGLKIHDAKTLEPLQQVLASLKLH